MALMVGKAGSAPHRPGGSKNTVEGRHAGTVCGLGKSAAPLLLPKCVPEWVLTCEAEPARRDCTCGSGSVSPTKCQR
jgi:hypothetical protein